MQELASWDESGDPPPKEWWHDHKKVDEWLEDKKEERKRKYEK